MKNFNCTILLLFFIQAWVTGNAQSKGSVSETVEDLPTHFLAKVQKKYNSITTSLTRKTNHYLKKLQKQEKRLLRKANNSNVNPPSNTDSIYAAFKEKLSGDDNLTDGLTKKVRLQQYDPFIDSLSTTLDFLDKYKGMADKARLSRAALDKLKSKINQSEKVKEFIAQRKEKMKQTLAEFTHLPASLKKEYANISKTAYYYSAQVYEYREMLKDPKKIEQQALTLLQKLPAFQKFMHKNSRLASLFNLPGGNANAGSPQALAGLQTRASVQGLIQQRIASGGPNAMAQVRQNLQNAQGQLTQLKDKLLNATGPDSHREAGFKPNKQKTKPFLKRLEYGFNVQFSKNNSVVPSSSDIGLTLGYKMNDKSIIGIGVSYKLGLGSIRDINLTSQGLGLRSFLDWKGPFGSSKIKLLSSLWISGGYEMNYYPANKRIVQVSPAGGDLEGAAWQQSALMGISKKYRISKKVKGEMKLLYDFLAREHTPVSQPLIFRLGYKF